MSDEIKRDGKYQGAWNSVDRFPFFLVEGDDVFVVGKDGREWSDVIGYTVRRSIEEGYWLRCDPTNAKRIPTAALLRRQLADIEAQRDALDAEGDAIRAAIARLEAKRILDEVESKAQTTLKEQP